MKRLSCLIVAVFGLMLAQSAVAAIGTTATLGGVDWKLVASTAALAAVLSLLTSVAGLPEVDNAANAVHD